MGFVTPLLSLTRFAWKGFPATEAKGQDSAAHAVSNDSKLGQKLALNIELAGSGLSLCAADDSDSSRLLQDTNAYPNVFTLRKSRTRRRNSATRSGKTAASPAQRELPLQLPPAPESLQLKIVQREPQKQPECLLISGRMADVCAALERLAKTEQMLHP